MDNQERSTLMYSELADERAATDLAVETDEFQQVFGEPLAAALDLDSWDPGADIGVVYRRIAEEIRGAVARETKQWAHIRQEILPQLSVRNGAPPHAGLHAVSMEQLEWAHRHVLFPGLVEACDGTSHLFDALPVSVAQIGVCLVSYNGSQSSWAHTLFRKDLRITSQEPLEEVYRLLEQRRRRAGIGGEEYYDHISRLARDGLMAYAERSVLLNKAKAPWRMGHGHPVPFPLLAGQWSMDLLEYGLKMLRGLLADYRRFLFVTSAPAARDLLTMGAALHPLEFLIIDDLTEQLRRIVTNGHYRQPFLGMAEEFVEEVGPQIVRGVYRASQLAPPQVFYAHRDYVREAALVALADSVLQEHRGFPVLIDLADTICRHTFSREGLDASIQLAYADAGAAYRFFSERDTRR